MSCLFFLGGWPLVLLRADVDIGFISFSKANSLTYCNYTVDGQNIETLDNFIPRAPPNFKVVFFFQGLRHVDKRNQTPQHDMSRTRCLTLTCGDGGVSPIFSSRFEYFLSIYGITLTIELEFFPQTNMSRWVSCKLPLFENGTVVERPSRTFNLPTWSRLFQQFIERCPIHPYPVLLYRWWFYCRKYFLCSSRSLGKWFLIWRAYFSKGLKPPTSIERCLIQSYSILRQSEYATGPIESRLQTFPGDVFLGVCWL